MTLDEQDRPWMKLTARDSGTGYYAWTEVYFDGSAFQDLPGGRVGTVNGLAGATATKLPAVEMNAQTVSTFPWYVRAERAIESGTVGVYYQFALGGLGTLFAFFTLPSSLTIADASKASCTVNGYWGGASPGSTITVYNMVSSSGYVFSGASGHKGLAVYDTTNAKFWIIQMECP